MSRTALARRFSGVCQCWARATAVLWSRPSPGWHPLCLGSLSRCIARLGRCVVGIQYRLQRLTCSATEANQHASSVQPESLAEADTEELPAPSNDLSRPFDST